MRRRRLVRGVALGDAPRRRRRDWPSPRSRWATSSPSATGSRRRRGSGRPTSIGEPPTVRRRRWGSGRRARLGVHLDGDARRPVDRHDRPRRRPGRADVRWLAYVATSRELGLHGAARDRQRRVDPRAVQRLAAGDAGRGRRRARSTSRRSAIALTPEARRGGRVARRRRHRGRPGRGSAGSSIDGPTFRAAFPQVAWLVGDADLAHWRGQLDYWVFLDGQIGRIDGQRERRRGATSETGALQAHDPGRPDGDRPRRAAISHDPCRRRPRADDGRRRQLGRAMDEERVSASATGSPG